MKLITQPDDDIKTLAAAAVVLPSRSRPLTAEAQRREGGQVRLA
jgi:hypothetical protein